MILDREEFRLWLVAKEPDEVVGVPVNGQGCAIANFVHEVIGLERGSICQDMYVFWSDPFVPARGPSPWWAAKFIDRFDAPHTKGPVTAKQALEMLDEIDA
jgi:hypothetical protein